MIPVVSLKYLFVASVTLFLHFLLPVFSFPRYVLMGKKSDFPLRSIYPPFPFTCGSLQKEKQACVLWGVEVQVHLWCWNVLWYVVETIEAE